MGVEKTKNIWDQVVYTKRDNILKLFYYIGQGSQTSSDVVYF